MALCNEVQPLPDWRHGIKQEVSLLAASGSAKPLRSDKNVCNASYEFSRCSAGGCVRAEGAVSAARLKGMLSCFCGRMCLFMCWGLRLAVLSAEAIHGHSALPKAYDVSSNALVRPTASGLQAVKELHALGWVHCDLEPAAVHVWLDCETQIRVGLLRPGMMAKVQEGELHRYRAWHACVRPAVLHTH